MAQQHPLRFEGQLVGILIPVMWIGSLIGAVAAAGDLGCIFSEACDDPWTSTKRELFLVLLLGPPLTIWVIWGVVALFIFLFTHPY